MNKLTKVLIVSPTYNEIEDIEDTITILGKYIDGLEIQGAKKPLNDLMNSLYNEALDDHNYL